MDSAQSKAHHSRSKRPVLMIDHRDVDARAIADAIRFEGFRPHTLPNLDRARVHLAGPDHFAALVVPAELGRDAILPFLDEVRVGRPALPVSIVTSAEDEDAGRGSGEFDDVPNATRIVLTPSGFVPKLTPNL